MLHSSERSVVVSGSQLICFIVVRGSRVICFIDVSLNTILIDHL